VDNKAFSSARRHFLWLVGASTCTMLSSSCRPRESASGDVNGTPAGGRSHHETDGQLRGPDQPYIDVAVHPRIVPIRQPSPNTCWAAVWTMMASWKEGRTLEIAQAVGRLGPDWIEHLNNDEGLEAQTYAEEGFLTASGLQAKPPANYLPSAYVELLASHGPLWINSGDGILNHATLMVGAQTRRDKSVVFCVVDPRGATFVEKSDQEFFHEFEREARAIVDRHLKWDLRYQIFYW
jgi:hypothetical protein